MEKSICLLITLVVSTWALTPEELLAQKIANDLLEEIYILKTIQFGEFAENVDAVTPAVKIDCLRNTTVDAKTQGLNLIQNVIGFKADSAMNKALSPSITDETELLGYINSVRSELPSLYSAIYNIVSGLNKNITLCINENLN